jgi:NitT/TauT family transport system ATP-binding protein
VSQASGPADALSAGAPSADAVSAEAGSAAPAGAVMSLRSVRKAYQIGGGQEHLALADVTFDVGRGEFVCVVGPSGAGKTTLLRAMAGLAVPTSGAVLFEGAPLRRVPDQVGVVFQDYSRSLYPWLTVNRNIALPLKVRGQPRAVRAARIEEVLASVSLDGVGRRYPWQLSGGMQQRVAIARALAYRPELLLMDEPFASVDAQTRFELEDLILRLHHEFNVTVIFVTHDIDEAIYLADRVVVLSRAPGTVSEIVQVGLARPRDQIATKADEQFARHREHILRLVMSR